MEGRTISDAAGEFTTGQSRIEVFGHDLVRDIIGQVSFTELLVLGIRGKRPTVAELRLVDAVLVTMADHGLTPSSLTARLVIDGAPESLQGAVAAGLLAVGSRFLGVVDEAAKLLRAVVGRAEPTDDAAAALVSDALAAGARVPGFGHNILRDGDPRVSALRDLARDEGVAGQYVDALDAMERAVADRLGPEIRPNATAAVAAVLSDLGYTPTQCRGIVLVARCAGLLAQLEDERAHPVARAVWEGARVSDSAG